MEHTIKGKVFCITGTLEHYTRSSAEAAITKAGGKISKSVGAKTDFLVCGAWAGSKLTKARSRGIPVIEEADLESFLKGETVEVDEEILVSGDAPMRDLVGEARAALDGAPDSAMWTKIVEIVDACAPDQHQGLVEYLEPQVARWTPSPQDQWRVDEKTHGVEDAPSEWMNSTPRGWLRVAPHHWIVEMANGIDSPKQRLVHAIHTRGMRMNGTMAAKILSCANLTNLRYLDVDDNKLSKTFFKKLRTAPSTRTLEHFRFSIVNDKTVGGIEGDHHLENLRELTVHTEYGTKIESLHTMLRSDALSGVRILNAEHYWVDQVLTCLDDASVMPDLHTVGVSSYYSGYAKDGLKCSVCRRVERVRLGQQIYLYSGRSSVASIRKSLREGFKPLLSSLDGITHIDLSGFEITSENAIPASFLQEAMSQALEQCTLPAHLERITLGAYYSDAIAEALSQHYGIEVLR